MKVVRSRAEARWLPSRHHFAIFRLAAFLRLWHARPKSGDVLLAVEHHQSTAESLITGFWYFATAACYIASWLPDWPALLAAPLSFAIAVIVFQPLFISIGLTISPLWRKLTRSTNDDNADLNAALCMLVLGLVSAAHLNDASWLHFVAWQFFLVLAMNASAAAVMFLLRERVRAIEAAYAGGPLSAA
jgi:hypothetical protein